MGKKWKCANPHCGYEGEPDEYGLCPKCAWEMKEGVNDQGSAARDILRHARPSSLDLSKLLK